MKHVYDCREQFPSLNRVIAGSPVAYLDGPGGTQVPKPVIDAIVHYYETSNANTHGLFAASLETDEIIEQARSALANLLGAKSGRQISFGQNMTTLNFALSRAIGKLLHPSDEIIVTDLDHDSNVAPWLALEELGVVVKRAPIRPDATLDMDRFRELITEKTKVVAMGYASNAVGTVNDVHLVRKWTDEVGAKLIIDAVHYTPHAVVDVSSLNPDFLLCSVYKFFGPHIGVLYSREGALDELPTYKVRPQVPTAPEKIETGTLNHASLAGVIAAVDFIASFSALDGGTKRDHIVSGMERMYAYEHGLAQRLYHGLRETPGVHLHGTPVGEALRTPAVSFTVEGTPSDTVAQVLGEHGIYVWDGDFYAMTLVQELGLSEVGGLVRVGMAPYNTEAEIDRLLAVVRNFVGVRV